MVLKVWSGNLRRSQDPFRGSIKSKPCSQYYYYISYVFVIIKYKIIHNYFNVIFAFVTLSRYSEVSRGYISYHSDS